MLGQIRLFDNNDETQTGKQGESQASFCWLQSPPCHQSLLEFAGWEKEGIGRAGLLPLPRLASPPLNFSAGDGHSERGEAWLKLILSADSQGLWK